LNAERSEAIERHEVPLEFIIAAMRLYQKLEAGSWKLALLRSFQALLCSVQFHYLS
jgi:hypothetical protein